jgi:hypothetical protein
MLDISESSREILLNVLVNFSSTRQKFVEALPYKPEGRGFDSRWGQWRFSLT